MFKWLENLVSETSSRSLGILICIWYYLCKEFRVFFLELICQISMMYLFCKNCYRILLITCFSQKISIMDIWWVLTQPTFNNKNTRARCEVCSKLTIKTPELRRRSGVFIVSLYIFHTFFWCFECWTGKCLQKRCIFIFLLYSLTLPVDRFSIVFQNWWTKHKFVFFRWIIAWRRNPLPSTENIPYMVVPPCYIFFKPPAFGKTFMTISPQWNTDTHKNKLVAKSFLVSNTFISKTRLRINVK